MKTLSVLAVALLAAPAFADHHEEKTTAKCPVMDRPINKEFSTEYKDATVYFCCAKCVGKFEENTDKYAAKANAQLVATGQAKQTACPITGGKINPDKKAEVAGVEVNFCCGNCEGKVKSADEKKAMMLVFSDKAFVKAFEVKGDK